jgi:hypothetical protein
VDRNHVLSPQRIWLPSIGKPATLPERASAPVWTL